MLQPFPESERTLFHVRVVRGVDDGQHFATPEQSITIGRSAECRLVLNDLKASRIHGELVFAGHRAVYRDLMSHNGSRIEMPDGLRTDSMARTIADAADASERQIENITDYSC